MIFPQIKSWARRYAPVVVRLYRRYRVSQLNRMVVVRPAVDLSSHHRPRLLIDVTHTASTNYVTGIQRVVLRLTKEIMSLETTSFEPVPVHLRQSGNKFKLSRATELEDRLGIVASAAHDISIREGDILFMLDSSWREFSMYAKSVFPVLRQQNGLVVSCLYDLIPVTHPRFFDSDLAKAFARWLPTMAANSDIILCISEATRVAFEAQASTTDLPHNAILRSFHLGADFRSTGQQDASLKTRKPTVLMVGTIEPRKGHAMTLDAFDLLWNEGIDIRFVVVGKSGWLVDDLIDRFKQHPKFGTDLILNLSATDNDLAAAYADADIILSSSVVEGFGLPLVEAAAFCKSIITSDIPTSREICGDNAIYFKVGDVADLAAKLKSWLNSGAPPPPHYISWKQSAEQALAQIEIARSIWRTRSSPP